MIKVEIKGIEEKEITGMSLFHGEGDAVKGTAITFVVLEGSGMFYAGKNEAVAIEGREYYFWFACEPGKALFLLQEAAETVNYKDVVVTSIWRIDVTTAKRIMAGYTSRIDELEKLAAEVYGSEVDASEDIDVFRKYNPWMIQGVLEVTEDVSFSAPEIVPSDSEILNLTQHTATPEQIDAGVVEPHHKAAIQGALTFDVLPSANEIRQRALLIAEIAKESGHKRAMIGGAPFFMSALENALLDVGIQPLYAFSVCESVEKVMDDGSVTKTNVFRHVGFVQILTTGEQS